jgi:hypothetical protein
LRQTRWCCIVAVYFGYPDPVAGLTYSELAQREADQARAELARAENARRFALRQADGGLCEYFLRVASRCEWESSNHAERARHFEALAARGEPIATP